MNETKIVSKDKVGRRTEYTTENGTVIKVSDNGKKFDIYDKDPKSSDHKAIHFYKSEDGKIHASEHDDNHNSTSDKEATDKGCYLTTACMRYFQSDFDDNCYELETLRAFRDKYVSHEDKTHYYSVAPKIVEAISKLNVNQQDEIYNSIYTMVKRCITFIENGENSSAYDEYRKFTLKLENTIL